MEQRMGEILEQVMQVQGGKLEELMQAIAAINLQNQKKKGAMESGEGGSGGNCNEPKSDWGRSTRYKFPRFDGEGFEGWMMESGVFYSSGEGTG